MKSSDLDSSAPYGGEDLPVRDLPADGQDIQVVAPVSRRSVTLGAALLATAALAAVALVLPVPYAVRAPGPTENTLGAQGDHPLIKIKDTETFKPTGELRLTTVSVAGGPGYPVTAGEAVRAWVDKTRSVVPVEAIFPETISADQQKAASQAEMVSSQESATVAALTELGREVPATLTVAGAEPGTGAEGVVRPDDVVLSFQGEALTTYDQLIDGLAKTKPGDDVRLGVRRDGKEQELTITTGSAEGSGRAVMGVYIDPEYEFPVDVQIQIDDIGGPSAGTMFALGIIDKLTPQDEANGEVIAGTGTISPEGLVGPIGGIEQKMYGALRDGATWFLAPAGNCAEVAGNVPDGLTAVRVATLSDARDAVEAIGSGSVDDLPACPTS